MYSQKPHPMEPRSQAENFTHMHLYTCVKLHTCAKANLQCVHMDFMCCVQRNISLLLDTEYEVLKKYNK